jgi:hypothetical protein
VESLSEPLMVWKKHAAVNKTKKNWNEIGKKGK